jgi:hypothetical protein
MKRFLTLAFAPLLLLAACDTKTEVPTKPTEPSEVRTVATSVSPTPSAAPAGAFQHDPKLNGDGYYYNDPAVKVGKWELKYVNINAPSVFAKWEAGERNSDAPIVIELLDTQAPDVDGQPYNVAHVELRPDSYRVDKQVMEFRSHDPRMGEVIFTGSIDFAALQAVRDGGAYSDDRPILTGNLQIGPDETRNIKFHHRFPD